jgi:hypothetical protein
MLRHVLPSGGDEAILDRALTLLLTDLARKRLGSEKPARSSGPGAADSRHVPAEADSRHVPAAVHSRGVPAAVDSRGVPAAADSRHVPAAVKRAVWVRDLGRCAFVAESGRRCGERAFVEFHHVRPYAAGGEATVDGIELRCREHNGYEARLFFPRPADRELVLERMARAGTSVASTRCGSGARTAPWPRRASRQASLP